MTINWYYSYFYNIYISIKNILIINGFLTIAKLVYFLYGFLFSGKYFGGKCHIDLFLTKFQR